MEGKSCCSAAPRTGHGLLIREKLKTYRPLLVILGVSFAAALALPLPFMPALMGLFLCMLAALQLFDLPGFADTFARYDLLAKRSRAYALAYPFIEIALGCLYLSAAAPHLTGVLTFLVMAAGIPGILRVIKSGSKIQCACAGTAFALPVGYVTLAENTGMALMGLLMFLN